MLVVLRFTTQAFSVCQQKHTTGKHCSCIELLITNSLFLLFFSTHKYYVLHSNDQCHHAAPMLLAPCNPVYQLKFGVKFLSQVTPENYNDWYLRIGSKPYFPSADRNIPKVKSHTSLLFNELSVSVKDILYEGKEIMSSCVCGGVNV